MPRTMLPNSSYRSIEKEHGERGKYIFNRVYPWIARILFVGGVTLMTYGGISMDKDVEKGQKYFGGGAAASFVSGYALDMRRRTNQLISRIQKESEEDERIVDNLKANLEKKSEDNGLPWESLWLP
jgi:hypothetical protein